VETGIQLTKRNSPVKWNILRI